MVPISMKEFARNAATEGRHWKPDQKCINRRIGIRFKDAYRKLKPRSKPGKRQKLGILI